MDTFLLDLPISSGWVPVVLYALAALTALSLLVRRLRTRGTAQSSASSRGRGIALGLVAFVIGSLIGVLVVWLVDDVINVFGVSFTLIMRMWVCLAFGGLMLGLSNLWRSSARRKIGAILSIPLFVLASATGINMDFGAYPTLGDALTSGSYQQLDLAKISSVGTETGGELYTTWRQPADMPQTGLVGSVTIPAMVSGFTARDAVVYVPPAGLVKNPPQLPVMIMLSGQPGEPNDIIAAGKLKTTLDAYAAQHNGLAPIAVIPDQLGARDKNPMCVDSPLGNSKTYIATDVVSWVRDHLPVSVSPAGWVIGGFSQGGTCSIQFGAEFPTTFGNVLDISGELNPTIGATTVEKGFGGSQEAYDRAKPLALLATNAPFVDSYGIFGAGANDTKYTQSARTMHDAAKAAGFVTDFIESPNSAHDWHTENYVFEKAIPLLGARLGLSPR